MAEVKDINVTEEEKEMPLARNNFWIMAVAGVLVVLGFVLMAGSGSGIDRYNPDIFSARRIVVGPLISFLGFVIMGIALVIKPKDCSNN